MCIHYQSLSEVWCPGKPTKEFLLCDKKRVTDLVPGFCPFSYDLEVGWPTSEAARAMYEEMLFCSTPAMNRFWVIHSSPSLLKMKGCELLDSFDKNGSLRGKWFEASRRMVKVVERKWYAANDKSRFRHVMPEKWARKMLSAGGAVLDHEIRDMFTGHDVEYDIETCHMIWVPRDEDEGGMALYGFDLCLKIVHVFDPRKTNAGTDVLCSIHSNVCERLLDGFAVYVDTFFEGWDVQKKEWSFRFHSYCWIIRHKGIISMINSRILTRTY